MRTRTLAAFVVCLSLFTSAKDKPLVGILVYPGASGVAYVQYADIYLNGKRELYTCLAKSMTGSEYKRQSKILVAPGMVLVRNEDGSLALSGDTTAACAVPANVKVEGGRTYSVKELVDASIISGSPVASSNAGAQPPTSFLPGMQIYFIAAPDLELAEYLRAVQAQSITIWSDYLRQYAESSHGGEARKMLTRLMVADGQAKLEAYRRSPRKEFRDFE